MTASTPRRSTALRRWPWWTARSLSSSALTTTPGPRPASRGSLPLQLQILVRRAEGVAGNETDAGFFHARAHAIEPRVQPDRSDHRLLVNQLLDPVQRRFAALRIGFC